MSAHQALLPLGFSRQEHWSGFPFPSPMRESEQVKVKSLSRVRLLATPWTAAYQAPPSWDFRGKSTGVGCYCLLCPWTARRSNQSILKEISPGCPLEGMMLKLKLQYFGHLMRRVDSLEKTLMLGGIGGRRRRGRQRMGWLDGITYSMDVSLRW